MIAAKRPARRKPSRNTSPARKASAKKQVRNSPYSMRARDVMNTDLVVIEAGATLHDALQLMVDNKVSALPVIDRGDRCVGMVSATDIVMLARELDEDLSDLRLGEVSSAWLRERLAEHDFARRRVEEVMSSNIESCTPQTPLTEVGRIMLRYHVHRLPVVTADEQLAGVISTTDLLSAFIDYKP